MRELPPLRLFLDRSTNGDDFVKGVKHLCSDTVSIGERYGVKAAENVSDEAWLAQATAEGRICVGADKKILSSSRPTEIAAVLKHRARYLVYANNNLRTTDQLRLFNSLLPDIRELTGAPGPWAYTMSQHGLLLTSRDELEKRLVRAALRLGILPQPRDH
ncbi:PIN-like domain-containing protein [Streptomyces sp. NPDC004673]